ncbi:hypothetical protein [Candidatus Marinarcus aquaticus]|uniref:Uncharacterized protein n=1 Tax=Candidatus Marinarcus aquaticus TaxID=2044504 RepID=A0A4Q0XSJ2_9BACT|nr:hypothetical protein [Candidatus Marinarcus aquaticus]RXJ58077.1 hypothetical protein CRV04_06095 [Candidatus Marinarcus aquaticus]
MSINLKQPLVPMTTLKMFNASSRLIGIPKEKVQVIMTIPDITTFNDELHNTIFEMQDLTECFIITNSSFDAIENMIEECQLDASMISSDFKTFAQTYKIAFDEHCMKKALIIIDKNCQITHEEIV